ncbi:hypothetical protein F3N42_13800 [Marinihelvus fidelis]|uniref:Uncharacterized protein n=1 Tax=Marinihelvus fidelis TaxID=2613842 RepID=A0A5N0T4R7_9GAMM|nr:hypothetical protein [Marinihelvus fidelis]KAA9129852.1 hypothetical protein F3N42_13800 [Marinihelvus fidelis]
MNISSVRYLAPLCVAAGAIYAGDASAAVKLSESFNNAYYNPAADGEGVVTTITPLGNGMHNFYGALYTYDEAGAPTWLIITGNFLENQFENAEVPVLAFEGPVPASLVGGAPVGTATVTINSCNSISFNLDMSEDSGFADMDLGALQPVAGANKQCAYKTEFEGCPDFASDFGVIPRACTLTGVYNEDIVLTNDTTWVLDGLVRIGDYNENPGTITIEPGTTIIGAGQTTDYLYVSPGSKIFANGTPTAPIVLTSPNDGFIAGTTPNPGDLGGLVVSGNAPCNAAPCASEFDQTQSFGGDDPFDSSGEISYFQVRYAGIEFQPNAEVNSFTFQGVGSGTTVHHLQAYRGQDDGVEFFGGTVNVKYMVVTEGGDDAVDWDLGYSGNLQYGLVIHGEGFGEDFGIEGASNPDSFDADPRATPTVANYTFLGNGNGDSGILFKDGSGGRIFNTIVSGFPTGCIEWDDAPATYNAAGTPAAPNADVSAFNGVIIDCDVDFVDDDAAPFSVADYFGSSEFTGNEAVDPMLNIYLPMPGSPALSGGVADTSNQFIDATSYRGGFDGSSDWTVGWTHQVTGGE